jgi:hypothetical protein
LARPFIHVLRLAAAATAGAVVLGAAGCNILGPAFIAVHGPAKTLAQHTLEKDRPTIVFVDDRANILAKRSLRQQIAEAVQKNLLDQRVLTNVIDASAAMAAAAREPSGRPMDIASLGKAAGAEVVVYITVESYTLSPDGQAYAPEASYRVKVLDVTRASPRVWPEDRAGAGLVVKQATGDTTPPKSVADQTKALNELAERSGLKLAQLFYEHETHEHLRDSR